MEKKTRHVILYDNRHGRNDGPPLFYFNQLKKLPDTEVMHLLPKGDLSKYGKFDYVWWVDWGEDAILGGQKALQLPLPKEGKKIYIASDTHLDDGYRFEKAKQFDYAFFNQKSAVETYEALCNHQPLTPAFYLPHAAEPQAYPHSTTLKKYDLCFIGHMQEYHKGNGINKTRLEVLDHMFKKIPNFYFGSRNPAFPEKHLFEDAAKRFCESRIIFNISVGNDLNMRAWETVMTGSFLLTNKIPELENWAQYGFKDGIHYVSYSSLNDAVEKARYYLNNDEEREAIADMGYKQALKTGTYESRIKEVLSIVGGDK